MVKTNITPLINQLDVLEVSDLKILLVMYHFGGYVEPKELVTHTGLHLKTVNNSLKRSHVKNLIKRIEQKNELDQFFLKQAKEWKEFNNRQKKEGEIQN